LHQVQGIFAPDDLDRVAGCAEANLNFGADRQKGNMIFEHVHKLKPDHLGVVPASLEFETFGNDYYRANGQMWAVCFLHTVDNNTNQYMVSQSKEDHIGS
jgi:hypothetical protein